MSPLIGKKYFSLKFCKLLVRSTGNYLLRPLWLAELLVSLRSDPAKNYRYASSSLFSIIFLTWPAIFEAGPFS
jgi:hypothetical protein